MSSGKIYDALRVSLEWTNVNPQSKANPNHVPIIKPKILKSWIDAPLEDVTYQPVDDESGVRVPSGGRVERLVDALIWPTTQGKFSYHGLLMNSYTE